MFCSRPLELSPSVVRLLSVGTQPTRFAFQAAVVVMVLAACSGGSPMTDAAAVSTSSTPTIAATTTSTERVSTSTSSSSPTTTRPPEVDIPAFGGGYYMLPDRLFTSTDNETVAVPLVFVDGSRWVLELPVDMSHLVDRVVPEATIRMETDSGPVAPPIRITHGPEAPSMAAGGSLDLGSQEWIWLEPRMPNTEVNAVFVKRIGNWYIELGATDDTSQAYGELLDERIVGEATSDGFLVLNPQGPFQLADTTAPIGRPALVFPYLTVTNGCWDPEALQPEEWVAVGETEVAIYDNVGAWCRNGLFFELEGSRDAVLDFARHARVGPG